MRALSSLAFLKPRPGLTAYDHANPNQADQTGLKTELAYKNRGSKQMRRTLQHIRLSAYPAVFIIKVVREVCALLSPLISRQPPLSSIKRGRKERPTNFPGCGITRPVRGAENNQSGTQLTGESIDQGAFLGHNVEMPEGLDTVNWCG